MKLEVEYTINEGVSIWNGSCGALVDYLFFNDIHIWSGMPDVCRHRMLTRSREFGRDHILLFTHAHADHYSPVYIKEYKKLYEPRVFGLGIPESDLPAERPEEGVAVVRAGGYTVVMLETRHQGNGDFAQIRNSMLCIGSEGGWCVHCGDSILSRHVLEQMRDYGVEEPEAVFVNLYQIFPAAQRGIVQAMRAKRVYCVHYPFLQDDRYGIHHQNVSFLRDTDDPFLKTVVVPEPLSRLF